MNPKIPEDQPKVASHLFYRGLPFRSFCRTKTATAKVPLPESPTLQPSTSSSRKPSAKSDSQIRRSGPGVELKFKKFALPVYWNSWSTQSHLLFCSSTNLIRTGEYCSSFAGREQILSAGRHNYPIQRSKADRHLQETLQRGNAGRTICCGISCIARVYFKCTFWCRRRRLDKQLGILVIPTHPFKDGKMVKKMTSSDKKDTADRVLAQLQDPQYLERLLPLLSAANPQLRFSIKEQSKSPVSDPPNRDLTTKFKLGSGL